MADKIIDRSNGDVAVVLTISTKYTFFTLKIYLIKFPSFLVNNSFQEFQGITCSKLYRLFSSVRLR